MSVDGTTVIWSGTFGTSCTMMYYAFERTGRPIVQGCSPLSVDGTTIFLSGTFRALRPASSARLRAVVGT